MESSLKLQMDVKNNAEDLRLYMLDLKNWQEEMKKKEMELKDKASEVMDIPPVRSNVKRNSSENLAGNKKFSEEQKKVKRINAYDYSAWDKYDADKACAELDKESDEEKAKREEIIKEKEETKQQKKEREELVKETKPLKNIDEAFYEKELGNLFVKKEKWEDAIKCYTKAIGLDSKNAIYYANRALCFLKLKNFKCAEVDATVAIQIDGTYIKAYQRRAVARTALGQNQEAILDYKQVLKLEPKNTFANAEIKKLENLNKPYPKTEDKKPVKPIFNPKIIFKNEPKKRSKEVIPKIENTGDVVENKVKQEEKVCQSSGGSSTEENIIKDITQEVKESDSWHSQDYVEVKKSVFGEIPAGFTVVNPIHIPPHLRSKEPLRSIPIKEIFNDSENLDEFISLSNSIACDRQKIKGESEKKAQNVAPTKIREKQADLRSLHFPVPVTCVQFQQAWKQVKNNIQSTYSYLKKINLDNLPRIFRHSLESDLFGELLAALANDYLLEDYNFVYSFLYNLSNVHRFGSLILFMTPTDNENLNKCITRLQQKKRPEEVQYLCNLYEMTREL